MECVETFLGEFSVDELLDFSNSDAFVEESEKVNSFSDQNVCLSPLEDLLSIPGSKLEVPVGDLEDLGLFVSFSESCLSSDFLVNPVASKEVQRHSVPVKPRSKRSRNNGHIWSLESPYSSLSTVVSAGKKKISRKKAETSSFVEVKQQPRRCCSHCGVQKTPQWRIGPLGLKTLCNACGVRFKSGRLLPEYRPACSPIFHRDSL